MLPRCSTCGERAERVRGYPTCPADPTHEIKAPLSRCRCGFMERCPECREARPAVAGDGRPEHAKEGLCRACVRRGEK